MMNLAEQKDNMTDLKETRITLTEEITEVEVQQGSVDAAYERLNAISFSRSVQKLRTHFQIGSSGREEEQIRHAG